MTRFWLRRGPASWFGRALGWLIQWADEDGRLVRRFQEWSEPVLEEESMWAETFFFERGNEGTVILNWRESDDLDGVRDGFYATSSAVARISELVMGWISEEPERALVPGKFTTDFEALVHAVDSDRR